MKKRDIILINIPFTDLSESKLRPSLIVGKVHEDFLCCFLSSNIQAKNKHDILIEMDSKNNLKVDSVIKCGKLFTLHYSLIKKKLGIVNQKIYNSVIQKIVKIIQ